MSLKINTKRRKSITHKAKVWPAYYKPLKSGEKKAELRRYDRDYRIGDVFRAQEWKPVDEQFTGNELSFIITHIHYGGKFGLGVGFCILSLESIIKK